MGGSYGHILALGASVDAVSAALGSERAFLIDFGDTIAVFSESAVSDTESAAIELSSRLSGDVLGFFVFEDDVLTVALCRSGETIAEACVPTMEEYLGISEDELALMAEMMGETEPGSGNQSDPVGFVTAVGRGDPAQALHVLSDAFGDGAAEGGAEGGGGGGGGGDGDRVSATEQHRALLGAFELPEACAGWHFYYLEIDIDGANNFEGPDPIRVGF